MLGLKAEGLDAWPRPATSKSAWQAGTRPDRCCRINVDDSSNRNIRTSLGRLSVTGAPSSASLQPSDSDGARVAMSLRESQPAAIPQTLPAEIIPPCSRRCLENRLRSIGSLRWPRVSTRESSAASGTEASGKLLNDLRTIGDSCLTVLLDAPGRTVPSLILQTSQYGEARDRRTPWGSGWRRHGSGCPGMGAHPPRLQGRAVFPPDQ